MCFYEFLLFHFFPNAQVTSNKMSQLKGESFCALSPFQLSRSNIEIEAFNWLWFGAF